MILNKIVAQLQQQRKELSTQLSRLDTAIQALTGATGERGGKRRLSAAARGRIAAAQRARWAKWKKSKKAA